MSRFQDLFMAVPIFVCWLVAVISLHLMRVAVNKRLPYAEKISYFLPFNRWGKVTDTYKRLSPKGRLYRVWRIAAIGTAVFAALGLGIQLWIVMKK